MTQEEKQKLNEKILKWIFPEASGIYRPETFIKRIEFVCKKGTLTIPYFTESFDACLKWIVPKLKEKYCTLHIYYSDDYFKVGLLSQMGCLQAMTQSESLPEAFCWCVEKLIDSEVKK